MRNIKLASKVHFWGLRYPYHQEANQADVCYSINLQVGMGVDIGMYIQ